MNNTMLLVDCCGYTTLNLIESTTGGPVKFRGKFQEANAINKNKRMYTYEALASNVEKLEETMKSRGLYGELDHPTDSIVHLANASHIVTKLWWEGQSLMGEAEILPTPSGIILQRLIERNCRIGISSRGVGNGQTNNEGVLVIDNSNFKLITFDTVVDPSTEAAFQAKVTKEHNDFKQEWKPVVQNPKVNPKALVSYFGALLSQKIEESKK